MDLKLSQEFRCDAETFWSKLFFDATYNKALYLEGLKFASWEMLEQKDAGGTLVQRVRMTPPSEMPAAMEKLVGGTISYVENGTFDKAKKSYAFEIVPDKMADRLELRGTIRTEAAGEKRIRRIGDIFLRAKVFGLGGMIEGFMAKSVTASYEAAARFTNDWIQKKGL